MTESSRVVATTSYSGSAFEREYSVTAKHTPWKTTVTAVSIDDVEYPIGRRTTSDGEDAPEVEIRASGWLTARSKCVVAVPADRWRLKKRVYVTSAAAGGAGEVEWEGPRCWCRCCLRTESFRSAERRRAAHPERYALVSGLTMLIRLLLPLLGLGTLFAWLFDPIMRWMTEIVLPLFEPFTRWLQAVFAPVGQFLEWLFNLLFGWIPDISLGVPDWVTTTFRIGMLVLLAYFASRSNLKRRQKKLEESQADSTGETAPESEGEQRQDDRQRQQILKHSFHCLEGRRYDE